MQCERVLGDEIAERYLLGTLSSADREAYEEHYFECSDCFDDLENLRLLRQALTRDAAGDAAVWRSRPRWAPATWAAAAAVAALLFAGGYWWLVGPNRGGEPSRLESRIAEQQPTTPALPAPRIPSPTEEQAASTPPRSPPSAMSEAQAAARSAALAALAVVEPPSYAPAVLRGPLDAAARFFREAMRLYVGGDYEGARGGLRQAAELDPERPDVAFYLGICELLTGHSAAAAAELRRTIALGESPYLEDATFYLAKAHLRRAEPDAARAELEKTVRLRGEREQEARELLRKIEALPTSP